MKKIIGISAIALGMLLSSAAWSAEWTAFQSVNLLDTTGETQETLIIPVGNAWGAPSCPSASYVVLTSALASYKEMLASILTAKAAGLQVRFFGDCAANPAFFTATKVRLQ